MSALKHWGGETRRWVSKTVWPALYTARLKGPIYSAMLAEISDPWQGDAAAGRRLIAGELDRQGASITLTPKHWARLYSQHGQYWGDYAHGFSWLRDLREVGGEQARQTGRSLILSWIAQNRVWHARHCSPAVTAQRVYLWLVCYPFFLESASASDQQRFFTSLSRQIHHLQSCYRQLESDLDGMVHARALIAASLSLGMGAGALDQAVNALCLRTSRLILPDGGCVSRNPHHVVSVMSLLLDSQRLLKKHRKAEPEELERWIHSMARALRFFRLSDKRLPVMNGAQEGDVSLLDQVMRLSGVSVRKIAADLPDSGYMRADAGKMTVMFDTGHVASPDSHAGLLAFELTDRNDRLIVNCGHHPLSPEWEPYMRMTAAHSTIGVGHASHDPAQCEAVNRRLISEGEMMEAGHQGYPGISIRRKLFLHKDGKDLRGEDHVSAQEGGEESPVTIRFHCHPDVDLLPQEGVMILRARNGAGWRFTCEGAEITNEESLYLGQGSQKRASCQLVLNTATRPGEDVRVSWAFCRL